MTEAELVREFSIKRKQGKLIIPPYPAFDDAPRIATQIIPGEASPVIFKCPNPSEKKKWPTFLDLVESWFVENECLDYRLFGIFGATQHSFRVDLEFKGITVYFVDFRDAVHMKLTLCDHCDF